MISSPEINKVLRKRLCPALRQNGFSAVQARKAWGWHEHCVWVFEIRAVGNHFSQVTAWPPMSLAVSTGVYYDFIPEERPMPKMDSEGKLYPHEYMCHMRSYLEPRLDQRAYQSHLARAPERRRKDIWWIAPNGENMVQVVDDIAHSFVSEGLGWFNHHTDPQKALAEVEKEHDCYIKFYHAAYLARHLGYEQKYQEYSKRLEQERQRIGRALNSASSRPAPSS